MGNALDENLREIFSILPEDQAEDARQQSLENFLGNRKLFNDQLKWANFDETGKFLDGGTSDIGGYSIRPIRDKNEDGDIFRLTELVKNNGAEAGRIETNIQRNIAYWFLPTLQYDDLNAQKNGLRGFVLTEGLFREVINIFNAGRNISAAECRLAFQICAGLSLREAAITDELNFETKRSHLKSICSKMQCGGQSELVKTLMGQMTYLLNVSENKQANSELIQSFVQNHLVPETRIFIQRLPNGRAIQILEIGPPTGTPILLIHGIFWPTIFSHSPEFLLKNKLRLIVPLRSGYVQHYSSADVYGKEDLVTQSLEDIGLYHKIFIGDKISVAGFSFGGTMAIEYAHRNEALIKKLYVIAINTGERNEANEGFIGRMFGGLQSMANKRGMFRFISWQFKKYYSDEKVVARVLRKMFDGSKSDLDLLEGQVSGRPVYSWFVDLYQSSIPGIADDFAFTRSDWQNHLATLNIPICYLHGADDAVESSATAKILSEHSIDGEFKIIEGAGHHLIATHGEELWREVAKDV